MHTAPPVREDETKEAYLARATRSLVRADCRVRDAHALAFAAWDAHAAAMADERMRFRSATSDDDGA